MSAEMRHGGTTTMRVSGQARQSQQGDYTVELTIGSGSIVERSPLAFRIQ